MKNIFIALCFAPLFAVAQAVLPTTWNFSTPGVSTPPAGWSYNVGTNGNLTYAFGKDDALSARLDATGENIVINFSEKPGNLTYFISPQNAGRPWTGQFDVQESADGITWTTIRSYTSTATSATNFNAPLVTETLSPTSRWVRFNYTNKLPGSTTGGGNMALDNITIEKAPPAGVGINLKSNTTTLLNGGTFTYGNLSSRLFTIENPGTSIDLKIDSIVLSGAHGSDFSIGLFDSITPPNNGTDTFRVWFNPGAQGSRFATIKVYSNDAERNPYTINLYAIGGLFATEPINQAGNVNITNLRTHTMNVSFARATGGAEKYILLRKTGNNLTEVPVDGVTYKRGDYIGGAQVAYIGNDTALIRPTYILANTTYSFAAFSFNGPDGYENYNTNGVSAATVTTTGKQPGNYYAAINPSSASFITDLTARLQSPHDTIFYSNYISTVINNYLTRDTTNGRKVVNCVYTGIPYIYEEPFVWNASQGSGILSREHTFSQSWMPLNPVLGNNWPNINGREVLEFNDLHNLFPAHQVNANARRSNNPFGIVANPTYTSPTGFGKLGTDANGKTVYEPKDDQKGDVARALFYMLVHYNGQRGYQWRVPPAQDINILLQWHQQDPPSNLEIARNEYIFSIQKNRNPFIDNPEWVDRINFTNLTYIPDANTKLITLTAPNGNVTWTRGKEYNITWSSQNVDSVTIQYQPDMTTPFINLATVAAQDNLYKLAVTWANGTTYKIRLVSAADATVNSISGNITVVSSSVAITSPTANTELTIDSSYNVTWTKQNADSVRVSIQYKNAQGSVVETILNNATATNTTSFTVPAINDSMAVLFVQEIAADKLPFARAKDSVVVKVKSNVGMYEEALLQQNIHVYPIPSTGVIQFRSSNTIQIQQVKVYDLMGRNLDVVEGVNEVTILSKGIYFLMITTDKGTISKKVLIQ